MADSEWWEADYKKKPTFCPREASDDARMLPNFRYAYIAPRPAWVDRAASRLSVDIGK